MSSSLHGRVRGLLQCRWCKFSRQVLYFVLFDDRFWRCVPFFSWNISSYKTIFYDDFMWYLCEGIRWRYLLRHIISCPAIVHLCMNYMKCKHDVFVKRLAANIIISQYTYRLIYIYIHTYICDYLKQRGVRELHIFVFCAWSISFACVFCRMESVFKAGRTLEYWTNYIVDWYMYKQKEK